jgi:hypothetical protein
MLGVSFQITAPAETSQNPLVMIFTIDAPQVPPDAAVHVFKDGGDVPDCAGSAGEASPDPCVASRTVIGGGDLEIQVLTSSASNWTFGANFGTPPLAPVTPTLSPISGKKLLIKDKPSDPGKRKILFLSKDGSIDTSTGAGIDPAQFGAFLQVYNANGSGESVCIPMPAQQWTATGSGATLGYRYKDSTASNGPCKVAIAKGGTLLKAVCSGKSRPIDYSLDEAAQAVVGVNFIAGDRGYCSQFGGTIKTDSGTEPPNSGGKGVFAAGDAPAPATCAAAPSPCP